MLQLRLHDSEAAERISNDGMNGEMGHGAADATGGEAVRAAAGIRLLRSQED